MTRSNVPASNPQPSPLWGYVLIGGALIVGTIVFRKVVISHAELSPANSQAQSNSPQMKTLRPSGTPGLTRRNSPASRTLTPYLPRSDRQLGSGTLGSSQSQSRAGMQRLSGIQSNDLQNRNAQPLDTLPPVPLARQALSFVGINADAEAVWIDVINDPTIAAEDRKNLIEDLNEDGFPDPKHPTEDDLPLIMSRMALIAELAPDAIDDANAAAFQEAYKDLATMYARLTAR